MVRCFAIACALPALITAEAAGVHLQINAPAYAGQRIVLYHYLDLFTLRTEALANTLVDAHGNAVLDADVTGTIKATVRAGGTSCDLWLRSGSYTFTMPAVPAGRPRSLNGTTRVDPVFTDLDHLDVNALVSDLNDRLDAFVAQDLATDQAAGMQALAIQRTDRGALHPDSVSRPKTLFVMPSWSAGRVDTFEMKLKRFYADVHDPWFDADLDYGVAGLRVGPRANDRSLFERYLKDRPVRYDVPEYVRFFNSFFEDHLMRQPFRTHEEALTAAIARADADSVKALFAVNDFLRDDRLCELVVLTQLYANYYGKLLDRSGIRLILEHLAKASTYAEHRTIAANMLWDLTAMRPGGTLPSLVLRAPDGAPVHLDTLLTGATCIAVTATWCTYCEQEMTALEDLYKDYGPSIRFVSISLDHRIGDLAAYTKAHPHRNWLWLYGGDDPAIMDALRIHNIPVFVLLNDRTVAQCPAPSPLSGLPALLYAIKAQADAANKLKPNDGPPPPRR